MPIEKRAETGGRDPVEHHCLDNSSVAVAFCKSTRSSASTQNIMTEILAR